MDNALKRWAVVDCGKYPSEKNCKIKMMAPEDQIDEVVKLACDHAIKSHGYQDSPDLKHEIRKIVDFEDM